MLQRRSFAVKLTALITVISGLAIVIVGAMMVVLEVRRVRATAVEMVQAHARVIAANSTAALDFDDREAALETLNGLAQVREFAAATITMPDGSVFARYERSADLPPSSAAVAHGFEFQGQWLTLAHPIEREGEHLGQLSLLYDFGPARQRLLTDIGLIIAIGLGAMVLAFIAARRIQRALLRPVNELGRAAESIASTRDYQVRAHKYSDDELGRLTDVFNDMIEQIARSQHNLSESEQRFRTIADNSPLLMWMNDPEGCVFVNRAYLEFLGLGSQVDVKGMDWAQYVHPDDRENYLRAYLDCSRVRCTFNADFRFRRRDGEFRWMRTMAEPRLTATGEFLGYTGFTYDITGQRQAEAILRDHQAALEREVAQRTREVTETQRRLALSERMASLGTLSAGLGHDIGNILMPLKSHIQGVRRNAVPADPARAEEHFAAIDRSLEYLHNLSAGLRLLAHDPSRVSETREATQLAPWWTVTAPLLYTIIGSRITLEHDLPDALPAVRIEKHLLTQVLFNLVQNAAQALTPEVGSPPAGAKITIGAQASTRDGQPAVRINVSDNGPGMSDEVNRRCLEPYFTTKTRRISSGLGLPLVKGIIDSASGGLEVASELGKGSTFTVTLPAEVTRPRRERQPALVSIGNARMKAMISHLLSTLDYDVRNESDATQGPGLWVTDSCDHIPGDWKGTVVLLANGTLGHGVEGNSAIVVDAAAPTHTLRKLFQELANKPAV